MKQALGPRCVSDAEGTRAARWAIDTARDRKEPADLSVLVERATAYLEAESVGNLKRVINLTGVILHTGLGRARLAESVGDAVRRAAVDFVSLEHDMESNTRSDRQQVVESLLQELTGAERAMVVNNCAAGLLLSLMAHCAGREVILSRGEMVEIGGAFRMPDIVETSGAKLVEVGCTNKTHLRDYERAITEESAAILRCHCSNFTMTGFVESPSTESLVHLAARNKLLFIDDVGSGDLPTLRASIAAGADIVLASGDKVLGAGQAGIILCRSRVLDAMKSHPFARAARIDKLSLAALEATLRLWRDGREAEIPTVDYQRRSPDDLKAMAGQFADAWGSGAEVVIAEGAMGGGSIGVSASLESWVASITHDQPDSVHLALRTGAPEVLARIQKGRLILDPRCATATEIELACQRLREIRAQ